MIESKQAECTNSIDRTAGLRSREPRYLGATLGATRTDNLSGIRTHTNNGQEPGRGHELI